MTMHGIFTDNPEILLVIGIIVLTASLMLHLRKRHRQNAKKKADRQAAAQAVREAERKRQIQKGARTKTRPSVLAPDRISPAEPYDHTFTGAASPSSIAKWEAEIHQIGRQILGQIDSKMVVLQTLTLEANRTANRMELLLEHIEQIVNKKANPQTATPHQVSSAPPEKNKGTEVADPVKQPPDQATNTLQNAPADIPKENSSGEEREEKRPPLEHLMPAVEESPKDYAHTNLISAKSSTHLEAYTDILNELDAELEQIKLLQSDPSDSVFPATIIKKIPAAVSLGSGSPLLSDPLSLSSPRLPGDLSFPSITPRPKAMGQTSSNRVSMDSIFEWGGG